ncbi:MAG: protein kinase [Isosphaeraceae bacterium]
MVQKWYVQFAEGTSGPHGTRAVKQFVAEGRITPDTRVSLDGEKWFRASRIVGLFDPRGGASASRSSGPEEELAVSPGGSSPDAAAESEAPAGESSTWPGTVRGAGPVAPALPAASVPGGLPEQFGRYRILRRLGRGGMGTVYLAFDSQLERQVALKVPHLQDESAEWLERFRREARAAAAIAHPNLCPVHDVGEFAGVHYVTMEYVEGRPLSDFIEPGRRLSQRKLATLVRTLALALQEAHSRGIVHRDLKPANIMINQRNEPVIMDFGLARRSLAEDIRLTPDGAMLGTHAYMAPEQVIGDIHAIGPPCDVYSLGVVLYEVLTGRLPFRGSLHDVMKHVRETPPEPVSKLRADVDPGLEAVCKRAMSKRIEDRYGSMREMADALTDYLKGRPVATPSAVPATPAPAAAPAVSPPAADSRIVGDPAEAAALKGAPAGSTFWRRLRRRATAAAVLGALGYTVYTFPNQTLTVLKWSRDVIVYALGEHSPRRRPSRGSSASTSAARTSW